MQQPDVNGETSTTKHWLVVAGDATTYTFTAKYDDFTEKINNTRSSSDCKRHDSLFRAPVGRHHEGLYVVRYFSLHGFAATVLRHDLFRPDCVLHSVEARIVAPDGSPQRVGRLKDSSECFPDMLRERLATLEELERADSTLRAADGSVTVEFRVTILRHSDITFVDLCRPGQLRRREGSSTTELLHRTGLFSDVTLRAGERLFLAHRAILSAASIVFCRNFESLQKNVDAGAAEHITVDVDLDADVLEVILKFVYTGLAPRMRSMSIQLLAAAESFQLVGLKTVCDREDEWTPLTAASDQRDGDVLLESSPTPRLLDPPIEQRMKYHDNPVLEWRTEPQGSQLTARASVETCSYSCVFTVNENPPCYFCGRRTLDGPKFRAPDGTQLLKFSLLIDADSVAVNCVVVHVDALYNPAYYEVWVVGADGTEMKRVSLLTVDGDTVPLMKTSELLDPGNGFLSSDATLRLGFRVSLIHRDAAYLLDGSGSSSGSFTLPGVGFPPGLFSDVTLLVDGRQFPAHRAVLAAESSVFRAMFDASGMNESKKRTINIEGLSAEVIEELITWLYAGNAPNIVALATELLVAADRYDLPTMKAVAEDQLALTLNVQNVVTVFFLAKRYGASRLRVSAINWIARHFDDVLENEDWADMDADSLRQALDTLKWIARNACDKLEWSEAKITTVGNYVSSKGFAWLENRGPLVALRSLKAVVRRPRWETGIQPRVLVDPLRVFAALLEIPDN